MTEGALTWNDADVVPAPKDRLILVTSGWGWRREDKTVDYPVYDRRVRMGGSPREVIGSRSVTYKNLKPIGAVVMVVQLRARLIASCTMRSTSAWASGDFGATHPHGNIR